MQNTLHLQLYILLIIFNLTQSSLKVETVGDKYMTVSGIPEPCVHHARSICDLALDMMEIAGQVQVDGEPVQVIIIL